MMMNIINIMNLNISISRGPMFVPDNGVSQKRRRLSALEGSSRGVEAECLEGA